MGLLLGVDDTVIVLILVALLGIPTVLIVFFLTMVLVHYMKRNPDVEEEVDEEELDRISSDARELFMEVQVPLIEASSISIMDKVHDSEDYLLYRAKMKPIATPPSSSLSHLRVNQYDILKSVCDRNVCHGTVAHAMLPFRQPRRARHAGKRRVLLRPVRSESTMWTLAGARELEKCVADQDGMPVENVAEVLGVGMRQEFWLLQYTRNIG